MMNNQNTFKNSDDVALDFRSIIKFDSYLNTNIDANQSKVVVSSEKY